MSGLELPVHRFRSAWVAVATGVALAVVLSGTLPGVSASAAAARGPTASAASAQPLTTGRVSVAPAYHPPAGTVAVGSVAADVPITVDVGLASRNPSGLAAYANATEIPGTSLFHHYLSAPEAAAEFGAAPGAVATAVSYFEGFGLNASANPDGLIVSVSGGAAAVGQAFDTTFENYRAATGALFYGHPTAASLPGIAPWSGVYGLSNQTAFTPAVVVGPDGVPAAGGSCAVDSGGLTPCDVATAYDAAGLEANGTNGTGERIAVIDAYSSKAKATTLAADYAAFSSAFDLPTGGLSFLYPVPTSRNLNASGTNAIWHYEDILDIEWTHAAAPGASIEMVFSPNGAAGLYYAIDWVVAEKAADVISMSWGEPEVGVFNSSYAACSEECNASTDGSFQILGPVLELAAAEGISTFAASGDCGAAGGTNGVSVSYPASSPYVTGVGGTTLRISTGGAYDSETGWSGNSSGSPYPGCTNEGGSGGGFSVLPRPAWQTGTGTVANRGRGVPDVSADADTFAVIAIGSGFASVGGTSLATPIWAGFAAIADQYAGTDLGSLNPSLYRILASANYSRDFHDITTGKNGYDAGVGWDPVTGIGTPIVGQLVVNLARGGSSETSLATDVYVSPRFGTVPLTVGVTLSADGGTGTYALEGVAFGDGTAATVTDGKTSHTFDAPGVYSVQSYVVDSSGATAASPPVVVVVGGGASLSASLNASATSVAVGSTVTLTAKVTGGVAPYTYNFSLGDGVLLENRSSATVTVPYEAAGGYCAEVVVRDSARPADGGASARVPISVGGATTPACGNPTTALKLTPVSVGVRDAPADFPPLFTSTGGVSAPGGLAPQLDLVSKDRYTSACECTIFREPGTYTVDAWENDTTNDGASASTTVTVAPELNATFSASTLVGDAPLDVTFAVAATGGYFALAGDTHWSFGNGAAATGGVVSETYTTPGEYLAIASLSDRGDGNASEAFLIDVESSHTGAVGVYGTVTPAVNISSGTTVVWNGTAVGPAKELAGTALAWDLGNGAGAFGHLANETYYASVDALVDDVLPASVSVENAYHHVLDTVPISLPDFFATESGGFVPATNALVLSTQVAPTSGVVPLKIVGSATASGPGGAGVGWLFGDSASASGLSVTHVYYGAGAFTVVAKAYDGYDDVAQRLQAIVANLTLTLAGCGSSTIRGTAPFTVHLDPQPVGGAGPPFTYLWTLPDGTTSDANNTTLSFGTPGTYEVGVVVTDAASTTTECGWTIVVGSAVAVPPVAVVAAGLIAGLGLTALFLFATRPRRR